MNIEDIKPCPACGSSDAFIVTTRTDAQTWHQVECDECGFEGPQVDDDDGDDAVMRWNAPLTMEAGFGEALEFGRRGYRWRPVMVDVVDGAARPRGGE